MSGIPGWDTTRRTLSWPIRAYRSRISVQLIISNVLVVILTVVLVEAAVIGLLLWQFNPPGGLEIIDEQLGEQAAIVAAEVESSGVAEDLANASVNSLDQTTLDGIARSIASGGVPVEPGGPPGGLGEAARIAILDSHGQIVASSDSEWAQPGAPYTEIDFKPARTAVARTYQLEGDTTDFGNTFVLDFQDDTMAGSHPIFSQGTFAGVVLLQADGVVNARNRDLADGLVTLAGANLIALSLLMVPALIVSIPVGIFRARRISRRLEHLSDAATAMASGDMQARVEVSGRDELSRVGERFNAMVTQLDEADLTRKAFVSNVSHELRTPVAILRGNLEQMIASRDFDASKLEMMHRETVTLARLIEDLFILAQIEEAVVQVEHGPIDLEHCARHAVDNIAALAWKPSKNVPRVIGESVRVQQILNNLLFNALRHTPEGGLIVVECRGSGEMVEVIVADTGIGIAPDDLPHVFDRYTQGERSERDDSGSGLGLAIVKQLVETMGGEISVQSEVNQGTTFRFTLPVCAPT